MCFPNAVSEHTKFLSWATEIMHDVFIRMTFLTPTLLCFKQKWKKTLNGSFSRHWSPAQVLRLLSNYLPSIPECLEQQQHHANWSNKGHARTQLRKPARCQHLLV